MAKSYLRQIIMEELQKVLTEDQGLHLGAATDPRKQSILNLQRQLAQLGFLDRKDVVGVAGPKTTAGINQALQALDPKLALNIGDIQKMPAKDFDTVAQALKLQNKDMLKSIAVDYRARQATDAARAPLKSAEEYKPRLTGLQGKQAPSVSAAPKKLSPDNSSLPFGGRDPEGTKDAGSAKKEKRIDPYNP